MKNKKIYCVYCGEKNNTMDLKCKKCNKKLDPKENLFLDYIKDHIKDDLKGKTEDKIFSIIKNFIISHLYGSVLTVTLIFTIVSSIITAVTNNNDIVKVTDKPTMMVGNINNSCNFENTIEQGFICKDGYTLKDDVCIKEEIVDAETSLVCRNNYYLSGNRCISNETFDKVVEKECIAPEGEKYLDTRIENGVCLVNVCSGWTDGECSAGGLEEIDFTITEYCPAGTSLINGVCKKTSNPTEEKICEDGTLEDDGCVITKEEKPKFSCEEGYSFNEKCNICVGE